MQPRVARILPNDTRQSAWLSSITIAHIGSLLGGASTRNSGDLAFAPREGPSDLATLDSRAARVQLQGFSIRLAALATQPGCAVGRRYLGRGGCAERPSGALRGGAMAACLKEVVRRHLFHRDALPGSPAAQQR